MKKFYLLKNKTLVFLVLMLFGMVQAKAYNVTVAQDGSGNFTTVQAAIDAAPTAQTAAYTIFIKNGKYKQKISIPSNKPFLYLIGESVGNVILTWDDYSGKANPAGGTFGTSNSASVTFNAPDCGAVNITFENTTGDAPQALAINVNADRCAFKDCRFLGGQDTVLTNGNGNRQYFKNCYIDGVVDFIFGAAVAVFDSCVIYPKTRQDNLSGSYLTAANTPAGQAYGYVFRDCVIPANRGVTSYVLGRPWQNDGTTSPVSNTKVVFLNTTMSSSISATGWGLWNASTNTSIITYAEYRSKKFDSSLVDVTQRVAWSFQYDATQAAPYYNNTNMFGTWNPCAALSEICTSTQRPLIVSNFKGVKGSTTSAFTWNISWPISQVKYELFRSSDKISFTKVHEQTSTTDSTINYNYSEAIPPPGQTFYYYIIASKATYTTHKTDTVTISSTPTINVTGAMGSFVQGLGTPSTSQSYVVSGTSLTNNVIITAPNGYELSANGGTTWNTTSTPIVLTQDINGNIPNTSISVRLNGTSAGTYNGNILHASTGATDVTIAVAGTIQNDPLTVLAVLQQWPMTINNNDSVSVRSVGLVASTPTFNNLYLSNGTQVPAIQKYSPVHGQAFSATANGDGSWGTAAGGPGGNLNRTFYEQFVVKASATHSVRLDSLILSSAFYNTSSNTKLAVVYSKTGFTTADSTDVSGGIGADGLSMAAGANGGFLTPVLLGNETATTNATYRFALAGGTGVTLQSGDSLTLRLYFSCGSGSMGRYAKVKNVYVKGLATINPVIGDYRSHQTGDWTALTTWERWDGTTWVTPAPAYPVYNNSGTTTIQNGHAITVSATLPTGSGYIHLTKVNAGGQIIVNAGANLNIANDGSTATTDLQVDGTFTLLGGIFSNGNVSVVVNGMFVNSGTGMNLSNGGDTVKVGPAATYQHNVNNPNTPLVMLWEPTATFLITGLTTSQTGIFKNAIKYGNIVWNNTAEANYYAIRNTLDSANVKGKFTVASTGTTYVSFANTSCRISFPGGYSQTGGTVNFRESGTIVDTLVVGGDFAVTGGSFKSNMGTGTSLMIKLTGFNKTLTYDQADATNTYWDISGAYTLASNLNLVNGTYGLNVSGTLNTGTNVISGAGNFSLQPTAFLSSGSATGLNGNIATTGTKTLSTTGNYIFNGATAQVTGALLPAAANAITINNATTVTLSSTVDVATSLTLTNGKLLLGVNNIAASSVLGTNNTKYVVTNGTGSLKIKNVGVGGTTFPVGSSITSYTPAVLNNAGTVDNYAVRVKDALDNTVPDPTKIVNKQWTIDEEIAGGSNLTLGLAWLTTDHATGFVATDPVSVIRYDGTVWTPTVSTVTGTGVLASPYNATSTTGFTTVGNFAVANAAALPVTLLSFNASYYQDKVNTSWVTSNEINTSSFVVERSSNAVEYISMGSVKANNIVGENKYAFIDNSPLNGISYYRLKMIDKNGSFKYSKVVIVNTKLKNTVTVYPNPTVSLVTVTHGKANANAFVIVSMIDGRKVSTTKITELATQTSVDVSKLATGKYLLTVVNGDDKSSIAFIKQ